MYEVHFKRVPRKEREAFAMDASQKSQVDWNGSTSLRRLRRHLSPQGKRDTFCEALALPRGSLRSSLGYRHTTCDLPRSAGHCTRKDQ